MKVSMRRSPGIYPGDWSERSPAKTRRNSVVGCAPFVRRRKSAVMAEKLTELDTTKLTTPIKNWVSRKGNAALAGFGNSGRAKARHEVRLIANKLYKGWQRY